ncbi:MAG: mechanosensitive ion channel [Rickettsiaceae bacterium]|nr:MAG: mechanosensitive ion channel [Rickettsiaceae bacterium]
MSYLTSTTADILHNIWIYNLITVSGNHIKVGNVILAIIIFLVGIKYSTKLSVFIKTYVRAKLKTDKDAANALEKIIIYAVMSVFAITVLEIANVPLSTFAFIGGALAIGIGFGAQSLISNFIGSIVIMIERPLKIGDIVEIEGIMGTVHSANARCVIITTFSNIDVLIPNNKIMQNSVVNWTLNDSAIKYQIELKIERKSQSKFEINNFINYLTTILSNLDIAIKQHKPEVNLTKINQHNLVFLLNFHCNLEHINNLEYIKGIINLLLIENIADNSFTVEYLTTANIKHNLDKEEQA